MFAAFLVRAIANLKDSAAALVVRAAEKAELSAAATGHMVATVRFLYAVLAFRTLHHAFLLQEAVERCLRHWPRRSVTAFSGRSDTRRCDSRGGEARNPHGPSRSGGTEARDPRE